MAVNPLYAKKEEGSAGRDDDVEQGLVVRQRRFKQKEANGPSQRQAQGKAKGVKRPIKSKVTQELRPGADDTEVHLYNDFRESIYSIEKHSRIQTALSSCQTASLALFFLFFGFVCLFIIMPEIKSMSLSADIMANASIPMAESAMHVESIAQRVSNITDHVGDTVENVTESLSDAVAGAGAFIDGFGRNVSGNFDGLLSVASGFSNLMCSSFGLGCATNATSDIASTPQGMNGEAPIEMQQGDRLVLSAVRSLSDLLLGEENDDGETEKGSGATFASNRKEEEVVVVERVLAQTLQTGFSALTTGLSGLFCGMSNSC
jgi:hypothetical protein